MKYHLNYSNELFDKFNEIGIRCELDQREEKLGYRIRESQTRKSPYTLVIGDNERDNDMVTYRRFGEKDSTTLKVDEFIRLIKEEIKNKGVKNDNGK